MGQSDTRSRWNAKKERAAHLISLDELTDQEIATEVGISRPQLARWKKTEEFQTRLSEIVREVAEIGTRHAIARRGRRIRALEDRWHRMQRVIEERSNDQQFEGVAGGKTGLLVHTVKSIGRGDDFRVIDLYEVDTGLLNELRQTEKQAAQELGQWSTENQEALLPPVNVQINVLSDLDRYRPAFKTFADSILDRECQREIHANGTAKPVDTPPAPPEGGTLPPA